MYNEPVFLDENDIASPCWRKIEQYLKDRLALHRARNDHKKPRGETAWLRGQIAETKTFLALGTKRDLDPEED